MKIDKEFESLIPPLSDEEFKQLEENILAEGIRESLIVWDAPDGDRYIVDGHNRWRIIQKHGLQYNVRRKEFKNRNEVKLWMLKNQLGRRNLSKTAIIDLCDEKLRPLMEERAKFNSASNNPDSQTFGNGEKHTTSVNAQIAKIAGVSDETVRKYEVVKTKAPERIKNLVSSGEISINQGYHETMNIIKPNPKPIRQQAEERHESIKEKDIISINEIKADQSDQIIIALGICKDLIRIQNEVENILEDEDIKCFSKLENEDILNAMRTCNRILHQTEDLRKELQKYVNK